jgi:hypothetical protein
MIAKPLQDYHPPPTLPINYKLAIADKAVREKLHPLEMKLGTM